MKIGDKVRFVNEIGGGTVAGFSNKNIVLVEDEDGFQIPTDISEVIVVTEEKKAEGPMPDKTTKFRKSIDDDSDYDPSDFPVTFKAPVVEREGGEKLSAYLAFVPRDITRISTTQFDVYLINDCNYTFSYVLCTKEDKEFSTKCVGMLEPNSKLKLFAIGYEDLNYYKEILMQFIAYKENTSFVFKKPQSIVLKIDSVKFYKLHSFTENDFFEEKAMINTLVENDVVSESVNFKTCIIERIEQEKIQNDLKKERGQNFKSSETPNLKVVDLHASELLDSTSGLSNADILNYQMEVFRKTLAEHSRNRGMKIVFIHGKGEGVLRQSIIKELRYKYKNYSYQDASFKEYGFGATQVTIK